MHNEYFAKLKKEYFPLTDKNKDEFYKKIAVYVTDNMLDEFSPVVTFIPEPPILTQYKRLNELERAAFNNKNPNWREGSVNAWQEEQSSRKRTNESHVHWLREWMKLLEGDLLRYHKLKDKILQHQGVPQEKKKEVQNILDVFGGKIVQ